VHGLIAAVDAKWGVTSPADTKLFGKMQIHLKKDRH
jgi:hypothetical protein